MGVATIFGNVLLAASGLGLLIILLYRITLWARSRASGAYVFGALLIPLGGMGNVGDPDYKIINQSKQHKEEDDSGDPPNDEDEPTLRNLKP